jgi:hypothetical protein
MERRIRCCQELALGFIECCYFVHQALRREHPHFPGNGERGGKALLCSDIGLMGRDPFGKGDRDFIRSHPRAFYFARCSRQCALDSHC